MAIKCLKISRVPRKYLKTVVCQNIRTRSELQIQDLND
eukprot:UN11072